MVRLVLRTAEAELEVVEPKPAAERWQRLVEGPLVGRCRNRAAQVLAEEQEEQLVVELVRPPRRQLLVLLRTVLAEALEQRGWGPRRLVVASLQPAVERGGRSLELRRSWREMVADRLALERARMRLAVRLVRRALGLPAGQRTSWGQLRSAMQKRPAVEPLPESARLLESGLEQWLLGSVRALAVVQTAAARVASPAVAGWRMSAAEQALEERELEQEWEQTEEAVAALVAAGSEQVVSMPELIVAVRRRVGAELAAGLGRGRQS
jgi:hypothetical protein